MDPIESYFSRFSSLWHRRTNDWRQLQRFNSLAKRERGNKAKRNAQYKRLQQAWTEAVESEFGDLQINRIPETVAECKSQLRAVFVNIVDLVEYRKNGRRSRKPKRFENLKHLKKYSLEKG
jgi:hypothetical protein